MIDSSAPVLRLCRALVGLGLFSAASSGSAQPVEINTYAGEPLSAPALSIPLTVATGVAIDPMGGVYVASSFSLKIYRVETSGRAVLVAGGGVTDSPVNGDGGPGIEASFGWVPAIDSDSSGNLYFVDYHRGEVRRVDRATGMIKTLASGGSFTSWSGLAVDASGNAFISVQNGEVLRVDGSTGTVSTFAGGFGGTEGLTVDASGNLFASGVDRVFRRDAATGAITTVAGGGIGGDGGPAVDATLVWPRGLRVDAAGNLFIAEQDAHRVRRVDAVTGIISTIAGNGSPGWSGDGADARAAAVERPYQLALSPSGDVYISSGNRLRRVDGTTGTISTVAGNGEWRFGGEGLTAAEATFYYPAAAAMGVGGMVVADRDNRRVRRIGSSTGIVTTLAGPGEPLCEGSFDFLSGSQCPAAIAIDHAGNVFAPDVAFSRIRKIDAATGAVTIVAGNGIAGASGDGGPATAASIGQPLGLAVDQGDNLFFADFTAHRVRRIDAATGVITTVAGNGQAGYAGDGGPATAARLASPASVAFDANGNLYVADRDNHRIRRVDASGAITTVAGNGSQGASGDGGPATAAALSLPISVAADASGNLAIADQGNNKIRRVDAGSGVITTLAGNGQVGFMGMGGPAASAVISAPRGVLLDPSGDVFVVDQLHHRILRVGPESAPRAFFTVPPCRVIDTREPAGPEGGPSLSRSLDRVVTVAGRCQVPATAKAASLNLTVTGGSAAGDLRFYPGGGFVASASAINYAAGQTRANNAVLALGLRGDVAVKVDQGAGAVDLIVDVNGYFE